MKTYKNAIISKKFLQKSLSFKFWSVKELLSKRNFFCTKISILYEIYYNYFNFYVLEMHTSLDEKNWSAFSSEFVVKYKYFLEFKFFLTFCFIRLRTLCRRLYDAISDILICVRIDGWFLHTNFNTWSDYTHKVP